MFARMLRAAWDQLWWVYAACSAGSLCWGVLFMLADLHDGRVPVLGAFLLYQSVCFGAWALAEARDGHRRRLTD